MRKLLNRPWFVALLALGAIAFVGHELLPSRPRGNPQAFVDPSGDALAAEGEATPGTAMPAAAALKALSIPANLRDPFAVPPKPTAVVAEAAPDEIVERLQLSAIWTQGDKTFVLLNGQICQAGDEVGRFKVDSATQDGVWVTWGKNRELLLFGGELTVRIQSTARTAAAVSAL